MSKKSLLPKINELTNQIRELKPISKTFFWLFAVFFLFNIVKEFQYQYKLKDWKYHIKQAEDLKSEWVEMKDLKTILRGDKGEEVSYNIETLEDHIKEKKTQKPKRWWNE